MTPAELILLAHLAFAAFPVCSFRDPHGRAFIWALLLPACPKALDIWHVDIASSTGFTADGSRCIARRTA